MIEYLERLEASFPAERWLVRIGQQLGVARVFVGTQGISDESLDGYASGSRAWIAVEHPHLVPILSIERDHDRLVIVTGDDRGATFLQAATALEDPRERATWAVGELAGVAEAIAAMRFRDREFVHRDLQPRELIVGSDGRARVRALVPKEGRVRGTGTWTGRATTIKGIDWLSPEQAKGMEPTPATDVFTLALVLYSAVTLTRPFHRQTDFETLKAIVAAEPPPWPSCDPALAAIVMRNLAHDPADRDKTPGALAHALRQVVAATPSELRDKVATLRPLPRPAPHESAGIVGFRCAKQWDELTPTDAGNIRHCGECKHDVVQVRSLGAIIPLLGKRCISYLPE